MSKDIQEALLDLRARQEAGEHMPCPRCGRDTMKPALVTNALSRHADGIYVCDDCGTAEAMLDFMLNMAIELRGFDDLQDDMVNMAYALDQGPGVNRALQAGAVPIEEQMLHNASTDPQIITDTLHSSIHTGKVRQRHGGGKQITIGVHHAEHGAYYANPVEFGHGGPAPAPAHPFVRPAFDTKADEAFSEIKRVLRDELKNR